LPESISRKRGESNFVNAFKDALLDEHTCCVLAKEFDLVGYGIADLMCVYPTEGKLQFVAFELKIDDWRRALSQAYRYTYFADLSVVVLPAHLKEKEVEIIQHFRNAGVGLWYFDSKAKQIVKSYMPIDAEFRNQSARNKALKVLMRKVKFRKFSESFETVK
jgi:hypothetical protein